MNALILWHMTHDLFKTLANNEYIYIWIHRQKRTFASRSLHLSSYIFNVTSGDQISSKLTQMIRSWLPFLCRSHPQWVNCQPLLKLCWENLVRQVTIHTIKQQLNDGVSSFVKPHTQPPTMSIQYAWMMGTTQTTKQDNQSRFCWILSCVCCFLF